LILFHLRSSIPGDPICHGCHSITLHGYFAAGGRDVGIRPASPGASTPDACRPLPRHRPPDPMPGAVLPRPPRGRTVGRGRPLDANVRDLDELFRACRRGGGTGRRGCFLCGRFRRPAGGRSPVPAFGLWQTGARRAGEGASKSMLVRCLCLSSHQQGEIFREAGWPGAHAVDLIHFGSLCIFIFFDRATDGVYSYWQPSQSAKMPLSRLRAR
jgi:hypothetical protein